MNDDSGIELWGNFFTPKDKTEIDEGVQEFLELRGGKHFDSWIKIGKTIKHGSDWAKSYSGCSAGRRYNEPFGDFLKANGFTEDKLGRTDRAALLKIMNDLPAVQEWRKTNPYVVKLSSPQTISNEFRKWKEAVCRRAALARLAASAAGVIVLRLMWVFVG